MPRVPRSSKTDRSRFRRVTLAAVFAGVALSIGACGNTLDAEDLEGELVDQLSTDAGVDPEGVSVDCPGDIEAEEGRKFECNLTAPNGDEVTVEVTLTDDKGGFEAEVPPEQFE